MEWWFWKKFSSWEYTRVVVFGTSKQNWLNCELMALCFALVWGITEEKCWILMLWQVSRAQNTFSLIHCHFRRGTVCVFIFKFSFAFILYENTWGMFGLLLTCCVLSVPIKSITLFKRPMSEGEKRAENNQCACNTRLPLTSRVSSSS